MHPALAAHFLKPAKLCDGIEMIIDTQIEIGPLLLAVNEQRGGLLAALIAACGFAGLQRSDEAAWKRLRGARNECLCGFGDHGRAAKHVAGDREPLACGRATP